MSLSYLTGDTAAELRWHLSKMNTIEMIWEAHFVNQNISNWDIKERSFSYLHPWLQYLYELNTKGLVNFKYSQVPL